MSSRRIAIIGLPGSGKSTFATKLGKLLQIPVFHLDKYQFQENKKRDKQEFISIQQGLLKEESWIIDGCSITTLEMRFARADTIIYLEFPRFLCFLRICQRVLFDDTTVSSSGCSKSVTWELIKYIWNFKKEKASVIEQLKKKYPHVKFITLRNAQEADLFLSSALVNLSSHNS